jgi:hypothetical protein
MKKIIIESVDYADSENSTDVVDQVHLSNGTTLLLDAGRPTFNIYDQSIGPVEVGAELVQTIVEGGDGDYRTHIFKNESVSIDILH